MPDRGRISQEDPCGWVADHTVFLDSTAREAGRELNASARESYLIARDAAGIPHVDAEHGVVSHGVVDNHRAAAGINACVVAGRHAAANQGTRESAEAVIVRP